MKSACIQTISRKAIDMTAKNKMKKSKHDAIAKNSTQNVPN